MRTVFNKLSKLNKILFYKDWYTIAYRRCDKLAELEDLLYSEKLWTVLPFNKNEWYADPFLFENNGDIYLFAEAMSFEDKRGCICVCNLSKEDKFEHCIKEPFHLSYPCIFKFSGKIYMIPESCEAEKLILYECIEFPMKWKKRKVLLNGVSYVDTTVLSQDDHLVLVETYDKKEGKNVFYRINLQDYSINKESAESYVDRRPGGGVFELGGQTYHALQNCDFEYGHHLHIAKADFENNKYSDSEVCTLVADNINHKSKTKFTRVHTFNKIGDIEVIDLMYSKFDICGMPKRLTGCIKHKFSKNE